MHPHRADYSQITRHIYIGSDLCPGVRCPDHAKQFGKLGIGAEVNLEIEHNEPVTPGLEIYLQIPVPDKTAPSPLQLRLAADFLKSLENAGIITYVHCKNGHGRAPTAVAAYFIAYKNMTVASALSLIKSRRPEIHLEKIQLAKLKDFETEVRKS